MGGMGFPFILTTAVGTTDFADNTDREVHDDGNRWSRVLKTSSRFAFEHEDINATTYSHTGSYAVRGCLNLSGGVPISNRRYSRLQICVTSFLAAVPEGRLAPLPGCMGC